MKPITRREALRGALVGGLGLAEHSAAHAFQSAALADRPVLADRPNIVFILADDLAWGQVGCYGQKMIHTPNIDRLAGESVRFTSAYSGCTECAPSRSVLMTGLDMGHTPIRENWGGAPIGANDITVASVLKAGGYKTGLFGKWGLGAEGTEGIPTKHGFDETFGYLHQVHAHLYYPEYLFKNDQKYPLPGNVNHQRKQYSHDLIAAEALNFIRRHKDQRFFCYCPLTLPHNELLVPEDSFAEYRGKFAEPPVRPHPRSEQLAYQPYPHAAYAAMVTRLDRTVGSILALLKELNLEQNTVVFFTSDNGTSDRENFFKGNGPFRGGKEDFYEGGLRVPAIVRWPGKIAANTVSDFPWSFQDVMPTLGELAGAWCPEGIDGISIVPTLLGPKAAGRPQRKHDFLYWEELDYNGLTADDFKDPHIDIDKYVKQIPYIQAVRMGDWKMVKPKVDAKLELYNLRDDIGETTNVAAKNPAVMATIREYLKTARTEPRPIKEPRTDWWQKTS